MKKITIAILLSIFMVTPAFATVELEDINQTKPPAYRVGTTDDIEHKSDIVKPIDTQSVKEANQKIEIGNLTYADLSLKRISKEISQNLDMDTEEMLSDLSLLWRGAATKSDIIKFALYKLSNPDADKPDDKSVKKVLQTIASMSTLVGAGAGSAVASGASFIGGNILGIMSQDDKAINYKYTKVNDADMIILVRKIDELQQKVMDNYYDYMTSRKVFQMTTKMVQDRQKNCQKAGLTNTKELIVISDAYYREAIDKEMKARSDFYSNRAKMEQLVGTETFNQFEATVTDREQNSKD
ncbi:hypothetical protein KBA27_06015 [bacterium]|nr:hypothetical protein [bacterium]